MDYIKLYGLERSGTNHLQFILNENFEGLFVSVNMLGWKHGKFTPNTNGENWAYSIARSEHLYTISKERQEYKDLEESLTDKSLKTVFVYKNPYSWYVSIKRFTNCKYLYNKINDIQYLMERWNNTLLSYLKVKESGLDYFIYDYETYINDEEKLIDDISINLNLNKKDIIKHIEKITSKDCSEINKLKKEKFNHDYYLNKEYYNELTTREIEIISSCINPLVSKEFNIKML